MDDDRGKWNPESWPESFRQFLMRNNIAPSIYCREPRRFVYIIKPELFQKSLASEVEYAQAQPAGDIDPCLYTLGSSVGNIAHTTAYKSGSILPLDPNSVLAVNALRLRPGEHVLDLCCAPGTKLVLMAIRVGPAGSVTGVDISKERLGAAVSLAKKYRLSKARLFCADGRTFSQPVHHVKSLRGTDGTDCYNNRGEVLSAPSSPSYGTVTYERGESPLWSSSPYRKQQGVLQGSYDKILVDAQCTHDGSIKHVRKHIESGWRYFEGEHFEEGGLRELYELQYALLCNGFRQLRSGGLLVYSTCSQSRFQNEEIIGRFMREHQGAGQIITEVLNSGSMVEIGSWGQALRLYPDADRNGGGFFICAIRRDIDNNR